MKDEFNPEAGKNDDFLSAEERALYDVLRSYLKEASPAERQRVVEALAKSLSPETPERKTVRKPV